MPYSGLPQNIHRPYQARGTERSAWHHEAVVLSWMRREKAPRLFLRELGGSKEVSSLPADAAHAQRPAPRATSRWVEIPVRLYELTNHY